MQFDCEEERYRFLAVTKFSGFMGQGEALETESSEGHWAPVPPETIAQGLWNFACGKE
jgi:hypothetical protein